MRKEEAGIERAKFTVISSGEEIPVHFNPVSLQYTVANQMQQQGGGTQQHVASSTGKLSMDLVFDTTHTGADVRLLTVKIAGLMKPDEKEKLVPTLRFEWGAYKFEGTMEGFRETLDFFSPTGVPLRAALSLSLAATDAQVFSGGSAMKWDVGGDPALSAFEVPPGLDRGPAALASMAGNPRAARALGAANGVENLRFGGQKPMSVSSGITLSPPVAFSPAEAPRVQASARLSAGVPASEGAFAGLAQKPRQGPGAPLDLSRLTASVSKASGLAVEASRFAVGGRALTEGGGSLRADVGAGARIQFDAE
jgi:Contractile injection system tube protein